MGAKETESEVDPGRLQGQRVALQSDRDGQSQQSGTVWLPAVYLRKITFGHNPGRVRDRPAPEYQSEAAGH